MNYVKGMESNNHFIMASASWCHQCQAMHKILEKANLPIEYFDVDDNPEKAEKYNVTVMPALILLNESNEELERFIGITPLSKVEELYGKYK